MLYYNISAEEAYKLRQRERDRKWEERNTPERLAEDAKLESDAQKRLAFIQAVLASERYDEWIELKQQLGIRPAYLEFCLHLGLEVSDVVCPG